MYCKECGKNNQEDAKFCESCGSPLTNKAITENTENVGSTIEQHSTQEVMKQEYITKGKEISKLYVSFFLSILKKPVIVSEAVNKSQLTNGIITIVLYSLMVPLMTYFGLKNSYSYISSHISFMDVVMKPLFLIVILIGLIGLIIFGVIKIGRSSVHLLDVIARLGAFLVVPTAFLAVATIFTLLSSSFVVILFLLVGLTSASFVIPLLIYSYKKEETVGLDTFYSIVITYIGIFILFMIIGEQAFKGLEDMIDSFNVFSFF